LVEDSAKFSLVHILQKWIIPLIILLISTWISHGQESNLLISEEGAVILEWESEASLFRIQIRRDGQVFLDKEHEKSEIRLNLAPGLYEYRIAALNAFTKEESSTAWLPLRVKSSRIPYFRPVSPLDIEEGESGRKLVVKSTEFDEDTLLQLIRGDERITTEWQKEGKFYSLQLPDSLEPGIWNLEARDISGKTFTFPEILTVQSAKSLLIHGLSVTELPPGGTFPIEIFGERFDKNMTLRFEGSDGLLRVVSIEIFNEKRALVYLDLIGAKSSDYTLIASNPNEVEVRFEEALRVEPAKDLMETKKREVKPRVEFHAGYSPMLIVFNKNELLPIYIAADIALLLQSGWETSFLRGLGAEIRAFGGISGVGSEIGTELIGGLDASAYYRPLVKGPIAPVFLVGVGVIHSEHAKTTYEMDRISVIRTGLGIDIVRNRWITRIGVNTSISFDKEIFPVVSLMLRQGLRY